MTSGSPPRLLLACLRGVHAGSADRAAMAHPQADWAGMCALARAWGIGHALLRTQGGDAAAGAPHATGVRWPEAVQAQLQGWRRQAALKRLQAVDHTAAVQDRLLRAGIASLAVGPSALQAVACDAAAVASLQQPPLAAQLLVRPANLALARQLLAGGQSGDTAVALVAGWVPSTQPAALPDPDGRHAAGSTPALAFDAVLALAEPLLPDQPGPRRAGDWHLLLGLWADLGCCADLPALLRQVAAIDLLQGRLAGNDTHTLLAAARQAGLGKACATAMQLARAWLGRDEPPAGMVSAAASGPVLQVLRWLIVRHGPALAAPARRRPAARARLLPAMLARRLRPPPWRPDTPAPAGAAAVATPAPGRLAITYDGLAGDGLGAQLQRICSLYAIARACGAAYVHTPVQTLHYQGLQAMIDRRLDDALCTRANQVFDIPSDPFDRARALVCSCPMPERSDVLRLQQAARDSGRDLLLQAHHALAAADRDPASLAVLRHISPFRHWRPQGPLRVCIHMRRGDRVASQDPRLQPNTYFLQVCRQLAAALQVAGLPHALRLHTELPAATYTLQPGREHMFIGLEAPVTVTPQQHGLDDFSAVDGLDLVLNIDPVDALCEFGRADVLVLSYSSFGYLGALLNPHALVITGRPLPPPRNFHTPLPGWLLTDDDGGMDPDALAQALQAMLVRRALQAGGG